MHLFQSFKLIVQYLYGIQKKMASLIAQLVKTCACNAGDQGSIPGLGRFPWSRRWQPTPVFLPGESHGQKSLAGYSPWDRKSQTQLSD